MMMVHDWYHAYTLQTQSYRETSLLLTCFTKESGIFPVIFRGAKRKRQAGISIRQAFQPYLFQCQGKQDLKTLTRFEMTEPPIWLAGHALFGGLYVNELLYRILPRHEHFSDIFDYYRVTLQALLGAEGPRLEIPLRYFECALLQALGYGLDYRNIELGARYRYNAGEGLVRDEQGLYSGGMLQALASHQLQDTVHLKEAKGLMRQIFKHYFPHLQLNSREYYGALYARTITKDSLEDCSGGEM